MYGKWLCKLLNSTKANEWLFFFPCMEKATEWIISCMSVHLCQPAEVIRCGFEVEKVWLSGFKKEAERPYFSCLSAA